MLAGSQIAIRSHRDPQLVAKSPRCLKIVRRRIAAGMRLVPFGVGDPQWRNASYRVAVIGWVKGAGA